MLPCLVVFFGPIASTTGSPFQIDKIDASSQLWVMQVDSLQLIQVVTLLNSGKLKLEHPLNGTTP